jgi:hypothetical protein
MATCGRNIVASNPSVDGSAVCSRGFFSAINRSGLRMDFKVGSLSHLYIDCSDNLRLRAGGPEAQAKH